jgi:hypothetical protein
MTESVGVVRRRQFCALCGQRMFEFYRSPDGHFGLVDDVKMGVSPRGVEVRCSTCGARYRMLDRVDAAGQPLARV